MYFKSILLLLSIAACQGSTTPGILVREDQRIIQGQPFSCNNFDNKCATGVTLNQMDDGTLCATRDVDGATLWCSTVSRTTEQAACIANGHSFYTMLQSDGNLVTRCGNPLESGNTWVWKSDATSVQLNGNYLLLLNGDESMSVVNEIYNMESSAGPPGSTPQPSGSPDTPQPSATPGTPQPSSGTPQPTATSTGPPQPSAAPITPQPSVSIPPDTSQPTATGTPQPSSSISPGTMQPTATSTGTPQPTMTPATPQPTSSISPGTPQPTATATGTPQPSATPPTTPQPSVASADGTTASCTVLEESFFVAESDVIDIADCVESFDVTVEQFDTAFFCVTIDDTYEWCNNPKFKFPEDQDGPFYSFLQGDGNLVTKVGTPGNFVRAVFATGTNNGNGDYTLRLVHNTSLSPPFYLEVAEGSSTVSGWQGTFTLIE